MRAQRAQAKAKRRAQVTESNARRDHRTSAVRALYALAEQVHLPGNRINAKEARNEDVERLVRLLEARMSNTDAMTRLRDAAKLFTDNGGIFSSPVLDVDVVTPAAIDRQHAIWMQLVSQRVRRMMQARLGRLERAALHEAMRL